MGNTNIMSNCCQSEYNTSSQNQPVNKPYNRIEPFNIMDYECRHIDRLSMLPIKGKNVIRKMLGSPYNYYDIIGLLGAGAYGKVFKIRHKTSNQVRAMKVISKTQINSLYTADEIENEIEILKKVSHPNIIKLFEFFSDEDDYYLINEYCSDGDLCSHVEKFGKIPELVVKKIMYDVFNAVSYLHLNNVIHGDLKLENVMVDNNTEPTQKNDEYLNINNLNNINNINNINNMNLSNNGAILQNESNTINNNDSTTLNINSLKKKSISSINNNVITNSNTIINVNVSPNPSTSVPCTPANPLPNPSKLISNIDVISTTSIDQNLKINISLEKSICSESPPEYKPKVRKISFEEAVKNDIDLFKNLNQSSENSEIDVLENYERFEMKLIDFGCSKIFSKKKKEFSDEIGTLYYLAPEILKNKYDSACDIWACGVIMYILLSGEIPFKGFTSMEIKERILDGKFCFYKRLFDKISNEAKDLIRRCFIYDPKQRITAKQALNHPFFKNNCHLSERIITKMQTKKSLINFVQFKKKSKFFQAVLTYLTHNFVKKNELTYLNTLFLAIDTDKDGKLSKDELSTALKKLNMEVSDENLLKIMNLIDFDKDGFIEYREFLQATIDTRELFTEQNLKSAFEIFDTKSDGTVSVLELEEILGLDDNLNSNIKNEFLAEINKTEDDVYTFEEFKNIVMGFVQEEYSEESINNCNDNALRMSTIMQRKESISEINLESSK